MEVLKIIGGATVTIALIYWAVITYMGSDYAEVPRLQDQIQKDLGISQPVELSSIHRQIYGWAEEGGDRTLLQLTETSCEDVKMALGALPIGSLASTPAIFNEYGITASSHLYREVSRYKGTLAKCSLALPGCALWRVFRYE